MKGILFRNGLLWAVGLAGLECVANVRTARCSRWAAPCFGPASGAREVVQPAKVHTMVMYVLAAVQCGFSMQAADQLVPLASALELSRR